MAKKDPPIIASLEAMIKIIEMSASKKAEGYKVQAERMLKRAVQMKKTQPSPTTDPNPPVPDKLKKMRAETARMKAKLEKK
jgi:hypothetical protein